MVVGIIGVGVVGGTLSRWFLENTDHEIRLYDPPKGHKDFLDNCDAIFISVPVPDNEHGQDLTLLKQSVELAQKYTNKVFIRSTVLPTTNDNLGTISMPEFLTERKAFEDMEKYPVLCGHTDRELVDKLFPKKHVIMMSNVECEMAKYAHNCFGAVKVLYWNIINNLSEQLGADYMNVLRGAMITGFIEPQHTRIALDGKKGYGGKCFPTNMESLKNYLNLVGHKEESELLEQIQNINKKYRNIDEVF
jgi:UDPglucose 6-dehydrogenase